MSSLTHLGNADRFAAMWSTKVKWCEATATWWLWDGHRWAEDVTKDIDRYIRSTFEAIAKEANECEDEALKGKMLDWARSCQKSHAYREVKALAPMHRIIAIGSDAFDQLPMALNTRNGVLNLSAIQDGLRTARPDELLSRITSAPYQPDAVAPHWEAFLAWAMNGDADMVTFLQRAIGYSLTSYVRERSWFFCWGRGRNGKSTFLNVVRDILGGYGHNAPADLFLEERLDTHPTSILALRGTRLVTCIDPPEHRTLDLGLIKRITGGDPIEGRRLFCEYERFYPTSKIWFAANDRPAVHSTSDGTWDRIVLIPWQQQIDHDARDGDLKERLIATEGSGILAWCVRGTRAYLDRGLQPPPLVVEQSQNYRRDEDYLGRFIEERCVLDDGPAKGPSVAELYGAYRAWCESSGTRPLSKIKLGRELVERGWKNYAWQGIRRWSSVRLFEERVAVESSVPF